MNDATIPISLLMRGVSILYSLSAVCECCKWEVSPFGVHVHGSFWYLRPPREISRFGMHVNGEKKGRSSPPNPQLLYLVTHASIEACCPSRWTRHIWPLPRSPPVP